MAKKTLAVSKLNRLAIYARDGFACAWCGATVEDGVELSLDHLKTQKAGGEDSPSNLVTACRKCNCSRGCRTVEEFAKAVGHYTGSDPKVVEAYVLGQAAKDLRPFRAEALRIRSLRNAAM